MFAILLAVCPLARGQTVSLSLEEYTERALSGGIQAQIVDYNLDFSSLGRRAALRGLYMPNLTASLAGVRSFTDNDIGDKTRTESKTGSLSLVQPLPLGTDIGVTSTWLLSETIDGARTLLSRTRNLPDVQATVAQPIYLFIANPRLRSKRRTELNWSNAQDASQSSRLAIIFDARSLYYNLIIKRKTVAVEKQKLRSSQAVYKATEEIVKSGRFAKVELIRADIRLKRDTRRVQNAVIAYEQAANLARDFIRLPPGTDLEPTSTIEYKPFQLMLPLLVNKALRYNPTYQQAHRQRELAELDLAAAKEGTRPRFNLEGAYTVTRDRSDYTFPRDPRSWSAGARMTWPLFDGTQTALAVRQSKISKELSNLGFETTERQIKIAVQNALLDVKRAEDQIVDFESQRKTAQSNLDTIRLQYKRGLSRLLDVFDAENELRDLELEYLNLLLNFNTSRDNLSKLVGKDVQTLR